MPSTFAMHLADALIPPEEREWRDAMAIVRALVEAGRRAKATGRPTLVEGVCVCGCAIVVEPS